MRRALLALALVACLTLAGCNALSGAGDDSPETTETVALSAVDYPDYTGPDGVENVSAFFDEMYETLDDEGYTATYHNVDGSVENLSDRDVYNRVERNPATAEWNITTRWEDRLRPNVSARVGGTYVDGQTMYSYDSWSSPEVTSSSMDYPIPPLGGITMEPGINFTDVSASHGVERGGTTLIVYDVTATEYADAGSNVTGQLVIDERGVVRELTVTFPGSDGELDTMQWTLTPETPEIERPGWVSRAVPVTTENESTATATVTSTETAT